MAKSQGAQTCVEENRLVCAAVPALTTWSDTGVYGWMLRTAPHNMRTFRQKRRTMTPETRDRGFPCIKCWGLRRKVCFPSSNCPQQPEQINKHCLCLREVSDLHQNQRSFMELYRGRLTAHTLGLRWGELPVNCCFMDFVVRPVHTSHTNAGNSRKGYKTLLWMCF